MGKIIMVASLKGGVGKTTLSASLAFSLARLGCTTLAIDMDFGVRSLDIALGHENSTAPSCWDVMMGLSSVGVAAEGDERSDKLFFMSAPMNVDMSREDALTQKLFTSFLRRVKDEYDYVILDMAAGTGKLLDMARDSGELDLTLIVCTQNAASVRAAEKLGAELTVNGDENIRLILNCFEPTRALKDGDVSVTDIIQRGGIKLLGVIPWDERVESMLSSGKLVVQNKRSKAGRALQNIALRVLGQDVPLFYKVISRRKRLGLY